MSAGSRLFRCQKDIDPTAAAQVEDHVSFFDLSHGRGIPAARAGFDSLIGQRLEVRIRVTDPLRAWILRAAAARAAGLCALYRQLPVPFANKSLNLFFTIFIFHDTTSMWGVHSRPLRKSSASLRMPWFTRQ